MKHRSAAGSGQDSAQQAARLFRWTILPAANPEAIRLLEEQLLLPPEICALLINRGYSDPDAAKAFLRPRLATLHSGAGMLGMTEAVERISRAINGGENILVHGDYDVDGICSTTLLTTVFRQLGGRVTPFIPHRLEDGYDLGAAGVAAAVESGCTLVVTCDCGTSALAPIAELRERGIDVIVSDHHLPGSGVVPECVAVLNPKRPGCNYPDKDLAAVGVAFKLALELVRHFGADESKVLALLDLVALATIADIAPLRGENRVLARSGLRMMRGSGSIGLRALLRSSGVADKPVTAGRIGFTVAPRLNAAGRLGRAIRGVDLLLSESEHEANSLAREFEELNRRRQEIDRETLQQAREMVQQLDLDATYGIVLAKEGWHPGVVGIVASRVVEETGRPAVLIALADGVGKGSGRSIPAFDLHSGLAECSDLLLRFGGHRVAAGVTIEAGKVDDFAALFNQVALRELSADDLRAELRIDLELPLTGALGRMEELLRHFEPFGVGNPGPNFLTRGVSISRRPRRVGENGLRFQVEAGNTSLDVIGWGISHRASEVDPARRIDIVYKLELNEWNGESRLQARLLDFRAS